MIINGQSADEMVIDKAHILLAHLEHSKTVGYLKEQVWLKDLVLDIKAFCKTCISCKHSKPDNQMPYNLLNPLSVSNTPWEVISVDFIGLLPTSCNCNVFYDYLAVIICLLTKMVHLVLCCNDQPAKEVVELMFEEVYKYYGIPCDTMSNWDKLFTSIFWQHLHKILSTKLCMSFTYHPQTDESTKRANCTITQILQQCINRKQSDEAQKVSAMKFAINSFQLQSTGYSSFLLNNSWMLHATI